VSSVLGTGRTTYTFDAAGNLNVVLAPSGQRTTHVWDDENRRKTVLLPDATRITSVYYGDGLRAEKQDPIGTTKFVWDNQTYLAETDGAGTITKVFTQRPEPYGRLVSQYESGQDTWRFLHYDGLGSTTQFTSGNQTASQRYLYDAFGNLLTGSQYQLTFGYVGELGYYADFRLLPAGADI
jgi:YD repeat-containing protein